MRFINTPSGTDILTPATPNENLLKVSDSAQLHIPRACQSGLCGSCTVDIIDASHPDGRQTVRACQTGALVPDGGCELIVDVERMKSTKGRRDPMKRFENLDTEYVARAAPNKRGSFLVTRECKGCSGGGIVTCYHCDGEGMEESMQCVLCGGSGILTCADCQGVGTVKRR